MYSYGQGINVGPGHGVAKRKPKKRIPTQFELDNYHVFGKFIINRHRLNNKNILLIKYPKSLGPIAKIPGQEVSDVMKNLINDILDTQRINIDLQRQLTEDEDKLLELLLRLSGLKQRLQYQTVPISVETYIKRYNILKGSLASGNDAWEVKRELRDIINLLSNPTIGKISPEIASELLEAL
jgi:signal transduction histidine kinase